MPERPNFLLITTDQQRWDSLGAYGNPVGATPHLDRLAAEGLTSDAASVANPLCMPSRSSILTGRYPRGHRVWCNGVALPLAELPLPELLRRAGYRTGLVGKAHFTPCSAAEPEPHFWDTTELWQRRPELAEQHGPWYGFDHVELTIGHFNPRVGHYGAWLREHHDGCQELAERAHALSVGRAPQSWKSALPTAAHASTYVGERTCAWLRERRGEPFFLWASFGDPHHPFRPPAPYCDAFDAADVPLPATRPGELAHKPPHHLDYHEGRIARMEGGGRDMAGAFIDEAMTREIHRLTYGMIQLVDENVGRILAELDALGLADNTVVLFTSDHGDLLGDHGLWNKGPFHYEGLTRVPLLWRWPGVIAPGRRTGALVSLLDLLPTCCDLAGVELPVPEQHLDDPSRRYPPLVHGRSLAPVLRGESQEHREACFIELLSGWRPDLNLRTVRTARWKLTLYAGQPYGELYDLEEDPHEFANLWSDPARRALRDELRLLALDEMLKTEDHWPRKHSHA